MHHTIFKAIIPGFLFVQFLAGQDLEKDIPKTKFSPILQSLILPGTGEYSLNYNDRGRVFLLVEGTIWLSLISSVLMSDILQREFQTYASEHANILPSGKNREFWVDIGNYESREIFNQEHLRFREFDAVEKYENDEWNWNWDGATSKRKYFESLRIKSDVWSLAGKFLIGGVVLNHIVSAIDVLYLQNRNRGTEAFTFSPGFDFADNSFSYNLFYNF